MNNLITNDTNVIIIIKNDSRSIEVVFMKMNLMTVLKLKQSI